MQRAVRDLQTVVCTVILSLGAPAWADEIHGRRTSLEGLDAVKVVIEAIRPDLAHDGLTQSELRTDVEGRLRH